MQISLLGSSQFNFSHFWKIVYICISRMHVFSLYLSGCNSWAFMEVAGDFGLAKMLNKEDLASSVSCLFVARASAQWSDFRSYSVHCSAIQSASLTVTQYHDQVVPYIASEKATQLGANEDIGK
jgi:hypothetical protein